MSGERVSASDVADLLISYKETNAAATSNLDLFIEVGHLHVENHLSGAGLAEELLTKIELFCSAHFVMGYTSDLITAKDMASTAVYARSAPTMGMTKFLKMAIYLDPTGTLGRALDKKAVFRLLSA